MNSKTITTAAAAMALSFGLMASAAEPFTEDVRQAIKGAADKVGASLASSKIDKDLALSVFFVEGDNASYVETLIRDAVLASGHTFVVPNDDENKLLLKIASEIAFDERKEGLVSPETVEKINAASLKSTQALIYGNIWTVVDNERYTLVELSLGAYSIKTKEFLWSGAFDCRYYKPGHTPELGLVDIPVDVRQTLKETIASKIEASIKAQPKLAAVKTAAIMPLVGDESANLDSDESELKAPAAGEKGNFVLDGYVTHIVVDGVSRTDITPRNADVQTRAEARRILRDKPQVADSLLFGAVRGLDIYVFSQAFRKTTYEVDVDIQISIESASTQDVLWSDTIFVRERFDHTLSWWEWLLLDYPSISRPKFFVGLIGRIGLGIVALGIIFIIIGKATRVR